MTPIELLPCPFCGGIAHCSHDYNCEQENCEYDDIECEAQLVCSIYCEKKECPCYKFRLRFASHIASIKRLGGADAYEKAKIAWNTRANKDIQVLIELKKWLDQKNNRPLTKHYTNSEYYQGQIAMLKCFTDKLEELQNA